MSYMSRNPQVASVVLDDITTTTPGNPPAGKHKIVDRMGNIFVRNSSGAETIIASAAGNSDGEKNYITNPSGAASISGWGNVGDLDIVRTATAAELPREFSTKTGLKITADANAQTVADYVYFDFSIDDVDMSGQVMKIKWDQKLTGTYTAGQLEVVITTQADRTTAVSTPFTSAIPASDGTFQTYFLAPATATASLVIRCTGEMATDGGIVISDVVVGPNVQVQGSAIGAWKAYTPTGAWTTNTTYEGSYREVGGSLEIMAKASVSGAPNSSNFSVLLPTGYTIDTSKIQGEATTISPSLGTAHIFDVGARHYIGEVVYLSVNGVAVTHTEAGNTGIVDQASPMTFANGDSVSVRFTVPVNELSSNVTLANRSMEEFAYVTGWDTDTGALVTSYGPSGAAMTGALTSSRDKQVTWPTATQSTDRISLEYADSTAPNSWVELAQYAPFSLSSSGSSATSAGAYVTNGVSTSAVTFARYRFIANDDSPTQDWLNTGLWRFRRTRGGASVGYPISSANIVGRTDGVAPAAGMVGEIIGVSRDSTTVGSSFSTRSTTTLTSSEADVISYTLNKGTYWVSGCIGGYHNDTSSRDVSINIAINSVAVTYTTYSQGVSGVTMRMCISAPIVIKTDGTPVSIRATVLSLGGGKVWSTNPGNEMWITRTS